MLDDSNEEIPKTLLHFNYRFFKVKCIKNAQQNLLENFMLYTFYDKHKNIIKTIARDLPKTIFVTLDLEYLKNVDTRFYESFETTFRMPK